MALDSSLRRGRAMEGLDGWLRFWRLQHELSEEDSGGGLDAVASDSNAASTSKERMIRRARPQRLQHVALLAAVSHYNDTSVVSASICALDACNLPTWPLRVHVAVLRRIAHVRTARVCSPAFAYIHTHIYID